MDAILFGRFHTDKFEAVSGNLTELPEIFWRDKRASDKIKLVKICYPFRIFFVGFLAFNSFDIFRVRKAYINVILEIIKNRNPLFSSGFHTNMIAIILDKPVMEPLNI